MTWKALKTKADRERVIKRYVAINSQKFNCLNSNNLAFVFINANAEVDCCILKQYKYRLFRKSLSAFKIPFVCVYRDETKPRCPLIFGERILSYEGSEG